MRNKETIIGFAVLFLGDGLGAGLQMLGIVNLSWGWVIIILSSLFGLGLLVYGIKIKNGQPQATQVGLYSIVWDRGEWRLQLPNGWQNYWKNESDGIGYILDGNVVINTFGKILIECVQLDIGGRLFQSDWESFEYVGYDEPSVKFYVPFNTQRGERTARIKAIVGGEPYSSDSFRLTLPKRT